MGLIAVWPILRDDGMVIEPGYPLEGFSEKDKKRLLLNGWARLNEALESGDELQLSPSLPSATAMSVKELGEYVSKVEEIEEVERLLEEENASQHPRQTAIKQLTERLNDLQAGG